MKKILLMGLVAVCCGLAILICASIRGNRLFNTIKAEMENRMRILAGETETFCMSEFTPFIWDEAYIYTGYSAPEQFEKLMGEKEAEYIETMESDHREIYYLNDQIVFDSRLLKYNNWCLFPTEQEHAVVLTPDYLLRISLGEDSSPCLYY